MFPSLFEGRVLRVFVTLSVLHWNADSASCEILSDLGHQLGIDERLTQRLTASRDIDGSILVFLEHVCGSRCCHSGRLVALTGHAGSQRTLLAFTACLLLWAPLPISFANLPNK